MRRCGRQFDWKLHCLLSEVVGFSVVCFSCRYGEHSTPFCVSVVASGRRADGEFSRRIHDAVERASLEVQSGSSSDEEEEGGGDNSMSSSLSSLCSVLIPPTNPEPKTIPTVSNPNSVYRVSPTQHVNLNNTNPESRQQHPLKVSTDRLMMMLRIPTEINLFVETETASIAKATRLHLQKLSFYLFISPLYLKLNSPNSPCSSFHSCNSLQLCLSQK